MSRLLYERSIVYRGCLIIPFIYGTAVYQPIYSYKLLLEPEHRSNLQGAENPAGLCSSSVEGILVIARQHLDTLDLVIQNPDHFTHRYTYRNHLLLISQVGGKYFYAHYPLHQLTNLAAPKLFASEHECINWIQQGLDYSEAEQR